MNVFKWIGILLTAVGWLCGAVLVAAPLMSGFTGSSTLLWLLFLFCFSIGVFTALSGMGELSTAGVLQASGIGPMLLALASGALLLGSGLGLGRYSATLTHWIMFFGGIFIAPTLMWGAGAVERLKRGENAS
ncbi:hypothetical protein [Piscinibacterium candidicorallinum]|uniref:Uncharacterized protein n=1 Tax=Piscinibacterium candidicorallinum TaxID=1793872 RepID=A0ABV7GXU7_9BURK